MDKHVDKKWQDCRTYTILALAVALGFVWYIYFIGSKAPSDQYNTNVAYLDMGSGSKGVYLAVWEDLRDGNSDIVGAIVDPQSKTVSSNFPLTVANGTQTKPAAAASTKNKEFLVVWADDRNSNGSTWDIYAQRVDNNGSLIGKNFAVTNDNYTGCHPTITYNSKTNEYLIVWDDYSQVYIEPSIYGKVISYDGKTIAKTSTIYGTPSSSGAKLNPSVAYISSTNEFLVVWEEWRPWYPSYDNFSINGQYIDVAGKAVGGEFTISPPILGGKNYKRVPQVAYNGSKNINLVVWEDHRYANYYKEDIYGILVQGSSLILPEFPIANLQGSSQSNPFISSSPLGFLVTFTDDRNQSTTKSDIYAQGVNFDGSLQGNNFPISNDTSNQGYSSLAFAVQDTSYLIVWTDRRNLNTTGLDIYGQHLSFKGALLQTTSKENFAISVQKVTGQLKP
jgi:hypothetical protein